MKNFVCKPFSFYVLFFSSLFGLSIFSSLNVVANQQKDKSILIKKSLVILEEKTKSRIGLYAFDTGSDTFLSYRANERFPMGCTSKVMGVATVLKQSMTTPALLHNNINYTKKMLDEAKWTPSTGKHLQTGMTVYKLCEAAIRHSDNLAMNLLIHQAGGINNINYFARALGDNKFKMSRPYPQEATAIPGDLRDTTTPKAMANSFYQLLFGKVLAKPQQQLLLTWLENSTTGFNRIRRGVPQNWLVGDKTGTGDYGTTNDVAVIFPPQHAPVILALYLTQQQQTAPQKDTLLASISQKVLKTLLGKDKRERISPNQA